MLSVMNFHGDAIPVQKQPTSYINNMMLPDMVQATRSKPLGPDCIISQVEVTDQTILSTVQYYWYISREKGCVECVVKKQRIQEIVVASDPRCVITRKHRRFEAYCCMLCRSNFVTIVQALLHLKGIHRANNKILIQDKDIFHNLDEAMEVPPVPLPWHVAKKIVEQDKTELGPTPTYVIPPGALEPSTLPVALPSISSAFANHTNSMSEKPLNTSDSVNDVNSLIESSSNDDTNGSGGNPMVCIISAITNEFKKQVKRLTFGKDCSEVNITFVDETTLNAKTPDLANGSLKTEDDSSAIDEGTDAPLFFSVHYDDSAQSDDNSSAQQITLYANKPVLARKTFASSFALEIKKQNLSSSSISENDKHEPSTVERKLAAVESSVVNHSNEDELSTIKHPANRQVKSVRFMLGAPDSSDDERSVTPERPDHMAEVKDRLKQEKHDNRLALLRERLLNSGASKEPEVNDKDTLEGLKGVVNDLMSTASKGRMLAIPSLSSAISTIPSSSVRSSSIPLVGSSPALSNMVSLANAGTSSSLTRVQSWSSSVGGTSFSVASMRRPYSARGFTYAEKIELMKQQNDYDAEFMNKHIRRKKTSSSKKVNTKQPEGSSSDGDTSLPESTDKHEERKRSFADGDVDSDDAPPSMIDINAMAAAYSNLIQSGYLNSGLFPTEYYGSGEWASAAIKTINSLQSSVLPEETRLNEFKKRHSSQSDATEKNISVKKEQPDQTADYVTNRSYYDNTGESFSDDDTSRSSARNQRFPVNHSSSRKRCQSNNESNFMTGDSSSSPPRRKRYKKHINKADATEMTSHDSDRYSDSSDNAFVMHPSVRSDSPEHLHPNNSDSTIVHKSIKQRYMPKSQEKVCSQSSKVPVSSLITPPNSSPHSILQKSKMDVALTSTVSSSQKSNATPQNPLISRLSSKSLGSKCPSDPALSSSSSPGKPVSASATPTVSNTRLPEVPKLTPTVPTIHDDTKGAHFLKSGDNLVLLDDVTLADFDKNKVISTRLKCSEKDGNSNGNAKAMMNMPEMFRNCIETCVRIQCVQKVHVCKVCGFSVDTASENDADNSGLNKTLHAHVMEHSLKELYATGYDMINWL